MSSNWGSSLVCGARLTSPLNLRVGLLEGRLVGPLHPLPGGQTDDDTMCGRWFSFLAESKSYMRFLRGRESGVDSNTTAYWLIALVIGVIVLEEILRRFGITFKRKKRHLTSKDSP